MSLIEKCPICKGRGVVSAGFYDLNDECASKRPQKCRSCKGKGIIKIANEDLQNSEENLILG